MSLQIVSFFARSLLSRHHWNVSAGIDELENTNIPFCVPNEPQGESRCKTKAMCSRPLIATHDIVIIMPGAESPFRPTLFSPAPLF
jgi:hypothetical protein